MAKKNTVTVLLTHHCRKEGCVGNIGETIEVSAADAAWLIERGGARAVGPEPAEPEAKTEPPAAEKAVAETDEAETASTRASGPARGRR